MAEQAPNTTQKRLRILGDDEIEALYGKPHFTDDERLEYFALSPMEKATLEQLHSIKSRIYFILQLGYFKSHHMFFVFDLPDVEEDARYIQRQYFPNFQHDDLAITKVTRLRQQGFLLRLYNYRSCDVEQRQALAAKARQAATVSAKPLDVFRELMQYMAEQRVVVPGYTFMQDTVGQALTHEQERLTTIVSQYLGPADIENLHRLLEDAPGLYAITQLKREPRDFSAGEIKREIQRGAQIYDLYTLAHTLLPALKISNESIKYYASLVAYYSVFRLKQLEERTVRIYLLCFVYHRYQRLHDHLINSLLSHVRQYTDSAKETAKDQVYEHRDESNENLQKAGHVLKLFTAADIAAHVPFHEVQAKAFAILEREKLDCIADHITKNARFDETAFQWEHVDALAVTLHMKWRCFLHFIGRSVFLCHAPHAGHDLIIPEACKSVGRHRGLAHRMLNVRVSQIILNGPSIMPLRREVIPARMPQLVGMGHKGEPRHLPRSRHNLANGPRGQRRFALRHEHIRRVGVGAREFPQQPELRTPQRMFRVVSVLHPVHIEIPRFEIDLVPPQRHEFRRTEPMAKHHHNDGRIAHSMASGCAGRLHHGVDLIRPQIVSHRWVVSLFPRRWMEVRRLRLCRKRTLEGRRWHGLTS